MKSLPKAIAVLLFAVVATAQASDESCRKLSAKLTERSGQHIPCHCGRALKNLEVTPPDGTRVEAVCGMSSAGKPLDLTRQKASLDRYVDGDLPQGEVHLSGELVLSGFVSYEPSDSGDLMFSIGRVNRVRNPVFRNVFFNEIKLGSDEDYRKLGMPNPDHGSPKCWSMQATLKIIDPIVRLSDTDFGGTYASGIVVLKKSSKRFFKCYS